MWSILVEEIRKGTGLDFVAAEERATELMLPLKEQQVRANRRAYADLLQAAKGQSQ